MIWKPLVYLDGRRGEEREKQCRHTITSECGTYRISRDRLDGAGNYTCWVRAQTPPAQTKYSAGTGPWHAIDIRKTADDAKRVIADFARSGA